MSRARGLRTNQEEHIVRLRRIIVACGVLSLTVGTAAIAGASAATAATRPSTTIVANGTFQCGTDNGTTATSGVSGTITFDPPLTEDGSSPEVTTINVTLSDCTYTSTNLPKKGTLTGTVSETISSPTSENDCTGLETSNAEKLKVKWTFTKKKTTYTLADTTIKYSGYDVATAGSQWQSDAGNAGFVLPGTGDTSKIAKTQSFAGSGHSYAEAYLNVSAATLEGDCDTTQYPPTGDTAPFVVGYANSTGTTP